MLILPNNQALTLENLITFFGLEEGNPSLSKAALLDRARHFRETEDAPQAPPNEGDTVLTNQHIADLAEGLANHIGDGDEREYPLVYLLDQVAFVEEPNVATDIVLNLQVSAYLAEVQTMTPDDAYGHLTGRIYASTNPIQKDYCCFALYRFCIANPGLQVANFQKDLFRDSALVQNDIRRGYLVALNDYIKDALASLGSEPTHADILKIFNEAPKTVTDNPLQLEAPDLPSGNAELRARALDLFYKENGFPDPHTQTEQVLQFSQALADPELYTGALLDIFAVSHDPAILNRLNIEEYRAELAKIDDGTWREYYLPKFPVPIATQLLAAADKSWDAMLDSRETLVNVIERTKSPAQINALLGTISPEHWHTLITQPQDLLELITPENNLILSRMIGDFLPPDLLRKVLRAADENQLSAILNSLNYQQAHESLSTLPIQRLLDFIGEDVERFLLVFSHLPPEGCSALLSEVPVDVLQGFFPGIGSLQARVHLLTDEQLCALLEALPNEHLQTLFRNQDDDVLTRFKTQPNIVAQAILTLKLGRPMHTSDPTQQATLAVNLPDHYLPAIIPHGIALSTVLAQVNPQQQRLLLARLSVEHLQRCVPNSVALKDMFGMLNPQSQKELMNKLGSDHLITFIKDAGDLNEMLSTSDTTNRKALLDALPADFLTRIITDADTLQAAVQGLDEKTCRQVLAMIKGTLPNILADGYPEGHAYKAEVDKVLQSIQQDIRQHGQSAGGYTGNLQAQLEQFIKQQSPEATRSTTVSQWLFQTAKPADAIMAAQKILGLLEGAANPKDVTFTKQEQQALETTMLKTILNDAGGLEQLTEEAQAKWDAEAQQEGHGPSSGGS